MYCRMSDARGHIVEVTVLGDATGAIDWQAGQFIAVFNAQVDLMKNKIVIGNDAVVQDRTDGNMIPFPESFDDVHWDSVLVR